MTDSDGLPQVVVDWAQVVGSAIGVLALGLSLLALWKSPRDILKERKRQFELDVLRSISDLPWVSSLAQPESLLRTKLLMLEHHDADFPTTRSALKLRAARSEVAEFDREFHSYLAGRYADRVANGDMSPRELATAVQAESEAWDHRWAFLGAARPGTTPIFVTELNAAIRRRVKSS